MSRAGIWSNRSGFTLVELAIVVLLLALFAGLTIPLFGGFASNRLDSTARRLAGTVKYLYNESAISGRPYRLTFDLDKERYGAKRLEQDGTLTPVEGTGSERSLPGEVVFEGVTLVGRGSFTSGQVTVEIQPIGWLQETVIHLKEGKRQLTLQLQPYTGTTKVYEGYRELQTQTQPSR